MAEKGGMWPHATAGRTGGGTGSPPSGAVSEGGGSSSSSATGRSVASASESADDDDDDRHDKRRRVATPPPPPPPSQQPRLGPSPPPIIIGPASGPIAPSLPVMGIGVQGQPEGSGGAQRPARSDCHRTRRGDEYLLQVQPAAESPAAPALEPLSAGALPPPSGPGGPPGIGPSGPATAPPLAFHAMPLGELFWRVAEGASRTRAVEFTHARRDLSALRDLIPGIELPAEDDLELDPVPAAAEGPGLEEEGGDDASGWVEWEDGGFN